MKLRALLLCLGLMSPATLAAALAGSPTLPLAALYTDQVAGPPPPAETAFSLADKGYKAYAAGDYRAAAQAFEGSLALDPDQSALASQLGYALRNLGRGKEAGRWFRHAITHADGPPTYGMRREVAFAENSLDATAYLIWRENALDGSALAAVGPSLTQSQGGTELAWTPPRIGERNGRKFQVFGRVLWGFEGDTLNIQGESYQAGVGARYKPLGGHNLVLTAERLIAIGDFARNEWMLRASYSRDTGFGYDPERARWTYATFYADAAVIDPASPDVFLLAEGRYGQSFRIAGGANGAGWVLTPHVTAASVLQHDSFHTTTLIEAGGGLSLKLWFDDTPLRAHGASAELLIQWRGKLAGDSTGPSGFLSTLVLSF